MFYRALDKPYVVLLGVVEYNVHLSLSVIKIYNYEHILLSVDSIFGSLSIISFMNVSVQDASLVGSFHG